MAENSDGGRSPGGPAAGGPAARARRGASTPTPTRAVPPPPGPDVTISRPGVRPGRRRRAGCDAAANRAGDVVVVFVQGTGAERRLVAGRLRPRAGQLRRLHDHALAQLRRPPLRWQARRSTCGARVNYAVEVDGTADRPDHRDEVHARRASSPTASTAGASSPPTAAGRTCDSKPRLAARRREPAARPFRISGAAQRGQGHQGPVTRVATPTSRRRRAASGVDGRADRLRRRLAARTVTARGAAHAPLQPARRRYTIRVSATRRAPATPACVDALDQASKKSRLQPPDPRESRGSARARRRAGGRASSRP